jgi:hypothetical protein
MGLCAVPLLVVGFATSCRRAEDSVRSGTGGDRFRLGVLVIFSLSDSWRDEDGDVKMISSMPPVLEDVVFLVVAGTLDVVGTWTSFLE